MQNVRRTGSDAGAASSSAILAVAAKSYRRVQYSRDILLRYNGYSVTSTSDLTEALCLLATHEFNLVLLCHSLETALKKNLISAIRLTNREIPIVVLCSELRGDEPFKTQELGVIMVKAEPQSLLDVVETLAA